MNINKRDFTPRGDDEFAKLILSIPEYKLLSLAKLNGITKCSTDTLRRIDHCEGVQASTAISILNKLGYSLRVVKSSTTAVKEQPSSDTVAELQSKLRTMENIIGEMQEIISRN